MHKEAKSQLQTGCEEGTLQVPTSMCFSLLYVQALIHMYLNLFYICESKKQMFRLVLNLLNVILNGENFAGITFTPKCLNFVKQVKFSYNDYSCTDKRLTRKHFWDAWLAQVGRSCNY